MNVLDFTDPQVQDVVRRLAEKNRDVFESNGVSFPLDFHDGDQIRKIVESLYVLAHGHKRWLQVVPVKKIIA